MTERSDARPRVFRLAVGLIVAMSWASGLLTVPQRAAADPGTVLPTETPTVTPAPTTRPTVRPTATVAPSPVPPTVTPRPTSVPEPTKTRKRHKHRSPTATPTATAVKHKHKSKRKHKRKHKLPHATATPTKGPTKTATPTMNLHAEDSITPVTCNGPNKANASAPLLTPPYHGWTSVVSYFDHDIPTFSQDGLIETATGASAAPDPLHSRSDFPAYWNASLRQYLYYDGHNGYDYNLWYQPVYAAAGGRVIFAAFEYPDLPDHGYGKMVMIDHRNGYLTLYGHFSRLMVHKGQRVKRGQQLGISGNTGHSTGPHLHFTVFHNCSPTDPYGWSGQAPDPLTAYQGESSTYLWRRAPLIANPLPRWPGGLQLPAGSVTRIALLRLPSTRSGTDGFTRSLHREANRAAKALRARGLTVKRDLLRAALVVTGTSTAGALYRLPWVVSITTPDTEDGDRADVLHALGLAARASRHARLHVARSSKWTGYLLHWQHRTFLVGTGVKGRDVDLHLDNGGKDASVHRLHADPATGAFAVDLGKMSRGQVARLSRELEGRGSGGSSITSRAPLSRTHVAARHGEKRTVPWLVPAILLLAVAAASAVLAPRRLPGRRGE